MLFITGATGFLGRDVVRQLLATDSFSTSYPTLGLLIRDSSRESAESRGRSLLKDILSADQFEAALSRVRFIPGDITLDRFGLGDGQFDQLARETTSVLHCAASTALNISRQEAERINLFGTEQTLALSRTANLQAQNGGCYFYVSTAYVAGDTTREVGASELNPFGPFRNHYEQSKAEAEALVREQSGNFPICIFRPSVVVGNSLTGHTTSFNVIYIPARLIAAGLFRVLPANPSVPFDVVPVDYVAQAMVELMRKPDRSADCYHLCAGLGRESSPAEIIDYLFQVIRERGRRVIQVPTWLPPDVVSKIYESLCYARQRVKGLERILAEHLDSMKHILPFLPYMISNPRFLTYETQRDLSQVIPAAPLFHSYARQVFGYCFESNWGRAPSR